MSKKIKQHPSKDYEKGFKAGMKAQIKVDKGLTKMIKKIDKKKMVRLSEEILNSGFHVEAWHPAEMYTNTPFSMHPEIDGYKLEECEHIPVLTCSDCSATWSDPERARSMLVEWMRERPALKHNVEQEPTCKGINCHCHYKGHEDCIANSTHCTHCQPKIVDTEERSTEGGECMEDCCVQRREFSFSNKVKQDTWEEIEKLKIRVQDLEDRGR